MLTLQIEYTDLVTYAYAELWSVVPFQAKPWYADYKLIAEHKGDVLHIGCEYKLDVGVPCWVGWEGTTSAAYLLWMVQAASESMLDRPPPALQLRPVRRGVNILRWTEVPEPELPGIPPGEEPIPGPDPEPEPPGHPPYVPDPAKLPMVTTIVGGKNTYRPRVHFWGTEESPGREIIYELPEAEYLRIYGEAGVVQVLTRLREQLEAGDYVAE